MHAHSLLAALAVSLLSGAATAASIPPRGSSPGVNIWNMGSSKQTFYFCNNAANGDGTADPGFTKGTSGCSKLVTSVALAPSKSTTVALATTFSGRIARSTDTPSTWVEVQFQSGGTAYGDVSLEIGCDGAATVGPAPGGGSAEVVGFSKPADIVKSAPKGTTETRKDGVKVISAPFSEGKVTNKAAADYLEKVVGNKMAYITTTSGTDITQSSNNQLNVKFY